MRVSFQYFQDGAAHLVASNGGSRPGTIGEAWLDHIGSGERERHYLVETTGNRFIPSASSRRLTFAIPCEETFPGVDYQRAERFGAHPISATQLVVSVVQFDGEVEYQPFPIDALSCIRAINNALSDCLQERLRGAATPTSRPEGPATK